MGKHTPAREAHRSSRAAKDRDARKADVRPAPPNKMTKKKKMTWEVKFPGVSDVIIHVEAAVTSLTPQDIPIR